LPNINIGVTPKGTEIMQKGKFENNAIIVNSIDAQNKLNLSKDMHSISFFISFADDGVIILNIKSSFLRIQFLVNKNYLLTYNLMIFK